MDAELFGMSAPELSNFLTERNIDTRPFFVPMHRLPIFTSDRDLPVSEDLARRGLSLPSGTGLTDDDIDKVCRAVREAHATAGPALL